MCYGSTTLIPTKHNDGLGRNYIDSDQEHVCRDFRALRNWTYERQEGVRLHAERNQDLIDPARHEKAMVNPQTHRKKLGHTKEHE